ncbi:glycoprotein R8.1 [Macacine gammaherpesvirus 5]|uniref:glycoprotein R8.1 n=1 Tax=Macacine gammaherpesvirus 5 TaxID=154334 RepID=UPI00001637B6|nr:glycoprotein R8.1 [Macacine gammaherpesvirus 5]
MGFGNIRLGWRLCFMVWVAWIARGRSVCPTWHLTDGKYEAVYRHYLEECRKHEGSGSLDGSGQTKGSGTKATTEANISIRPNVVTSGQNKEPPGTAPRAESSHDLPRIKQVNALRLSTPELAQPLPVVKSTPRESQSGGTPWNARPHAFIMHTNDMLNPSVVLSFRAIRARSTRDTEQSVRDRNTVTTSYRTPGRPSLFQARPSSHGARLPPSPRTMARYAESRTICDQN